MPRAQGDEKENQTSQKKEPSPSVKQLKQEGHKANPPVVDKVVLLKPAGGASGSGARPGPGGGDAVGGIRTGSGLGSNALRVLRRRLVTTAGVEKRK